jgi:hypothetical protein
VFVSERGAPLSDAGGTGGEIGEVSENPLSTITLSRALFDW